jgi:hypothetical protein
LPFALHSGLPGIEISMKTLARFVAFSVGLLVLAASRPARADRPLELRNVTVPAGTAENPIDRFVDSTSKNHSLTPRPVVDDRVFVRRVSLDLTGLLPSPERLEKFLTDRAPNKREAYVEELLASDRAYADHWMTFWNDALRNAYRGTGFIDGGRKQITGWVYEALYHNKPYDQFVRELIDPVPGAEGFLHGIKWRGVVNASQRREMQAAQTVAQVFLGTNLKCASCHDSFINDWKLADAYGMAGIFADGPVEVHHCDKPTGEIAKPVFMFPSLGTISKDASRNDRLKELAAIITSQKNGRFPRTIVNRLWANLFGRGLVEPIDEMERPAWNEDLLDWLAADFVASGYDLKHTLARICTSKAWQRQAVGESREQEAGNDEFVFRGPLVRRMTAEQFVDAVATVTGEWQQPTAGMRKRDGRAQGGQLLDVLKVLSTGPERPTPKLDAEWIWNTPVAAKAAPPATVHFYSELVLNEKPDRVTAVVACDNEFRLVVNEKTRNAAVGKSWNQPEVIDLTTLCKVGSNSIRVTARNWGDGNGAKTGSPNPAGLICQIDAWKDNRRIGQLVTSQKNGWQVNESVPKNWEATAGRPKDWKQAVRVAGPADGPWQIEQTFGQLVAGHASESAGEIRSVLADASPLTRALGQPGREQVVTRRDDRATMLQVLELTNGKTLDQILKTGAVSLLKTSTQGGKSSELTHRLYQRSLSRAPTTDELTIARDILGANPTADEAASLLWVLVMLPEFQLIR